MALVSMRELLDHAAERGYGIPAFNVNNLEQVQAIMEAAAEVNAPVIMQASAGIPSTSKSPLASIEPVNVETPATLRSPVKVAFRAVNSSNTKSSAT